MSLALPRTMEWFPSETHPLGRVHPLFPGQGCSSALVSISWPTAALHSSLLLLINPLAASRLGKTKSGREGKQREKGGHSQPARECGMEQHLPLAGLFPGQIPCPQLCSPQDVIPLPCASGACEKQRLPESYPRGVRAVGQGRHSLGLAAATLLKCQVVRRAAAGGRTGAGASPAIIHPVSSREGAV